MGIKMNKKKALIVTTLILLLGICSFFVYLNVFDEKDKFKIISEYVNANVILNKDSFQIYQDQEYEVIFCTDQAQKIHVFLLRNNNVLTSVLFEKVPLYEKKVDWQFSNNHELNYSLVSGRLSSDIEDLQINGIQPKDIKKLNIDSERMFYSVSSSIREPVDIKAKDREGNLLFKTIP